MRLKSNIFLFIICSAVMLAPMTASAGWGDLIKEAGTQVATQKASEMGLSTADATSGIKEVLTDGATSAVSSLGEPGGFMDNPLAKIPMPDALKGLTGSESSGVSSLMNKAAESVIPESSGAIFDSIKNLAIPEPEKVASEGGDDSITRFFEEKSRPTIKKVMSPLVEAAIKKADSGNYVNTITSALSDSGSGFDFNGYVTDKTLDGVFAMMADKEKSLRAAGGGASELLKKLF